MAARPAASTAPLRLSGIDALKAIACTCIVWHHLVFYGLMADVARPLAPALLDAFQTHGRVAVHVFLAIGGFLAAGSVASIPFARAADPLRLIARRYLRLAAPYLVALGVSVLAASLVRAVLQDDEVVPASPQPLQLLAHGLLLQDLLDVPGLSAGVWYVAIDFQLYALTVLVFALAAWLQLRWRADAQRLVQALVVAGAALSMLVFNLDPAYDETALYFFGSYGLGLMAWWAGRSRHAGAWLLLMVGLGATALAFEWRDRLAAAWITALLIVALQRSASLSAIEPPAAVRQLGRISYSVFLVHFPVCLLVAAATHALWPQDAWFNALGMVAAFALSVLAGALLHRGIESRPPGIPGVLALLGLLLLFGVWL